MDINTLKTLKENDFVYHRETGDVFQIVDIDTDDLGVPVRVEQITLDRVYYHNSDEQSTMDKHCAYWVYDSIYNALSSGRMCMPGDEVREFIKDHKLVTLEDLVVERPVVKLEDGIGLNLEGVPDVPGFPTADKVRKISDSKSVLLT